MLEKGSKGLHQSIRAAARLLCVQRIDGPRPSLSWKKAKMAAALSNVCLYFFGPGGDQITSRDMEKLLERSYFFDRFGLMKFSVKTKLRLAALRIVDEKVRHRMLADINSAFGPLQTPGMPVVFTHITIGNRYANIQR